MKKKIVLLLSIILLTGCTINYDLDITDGGINETINGKVSKEKVLDDKNEYNMNIYYYLLNNDQPALTNSDDLYTTNIKENKKTYDYTASYTYQNLDDLSSSRIINNCFENSSVIDEEDYYSISLSGDFYCLYSDKVKVSIHSDYAIISSNADKTNNNTYTWTLEEDKTDIELILSKDIKYQKSETKTSSIRIISFIILIILVTITYLLYKKKNSNDTF